MRLLNIHTFDLRDFSPAETPPYIITSHRWLSDEATYKDVLKCKNVHTRGYKKIQGFCEFAANSKVGQSNISWLWVDTACINKESSAELSESINSMGRWYGCAEYCIAYLADVSYYSPTSMFDEFVKSEWHRRGWPLQEMLMPQCVVFVTREWEVIGSKGSNLNNLINPYMVLDALLRATPIPYDALESPAGALHYTDEEKMSWMRGRQTSKPEDIVYCLLGILNVHLPLIYGEGEANARRRLLEELSKKKEASKPKKPSWFSRRKEGLSRNWDEFSGGAFSGNGVVATAAALSAIAASAATREK